MGQLREINADGKKSVMCQSCGKRIYGGEKVVRVQYGTLHFTGHPHASVWADRIDFFHAKCEKAFVSLPEGGASPISTASCGCESHKEGNKRYTRLCQKHAAEKCNRMFFGQDGGTDSVEDNTNASPSSQTEKMEGD